MWLYSIIDVKGTYVEGIKEEVVLSPGHALSFIAAGEGTCIDNDSYTFPPNCILLKYNIIHG